MYEINTATVTGWSKAKGYENAYVPDALDVACPHCPRNPVMFPLEDWIIRSDIDTATGRCPACRNTIRVWLYKRPHTYDEEQFAKTRIFMLPKPQLHPAFDPEIEQISPSYVKIYNQAFEAEAQGLDELVGMGLRKALEFLIKDFLITQKPELEDQIKKDLLQPVIQKYVDDPNIKTVAERAVWLGNDETHYIRTWTQHDVDDLKDLLRLTNYWVASTLMTQRLVKEMPKKPRSS